MKLLFQVQLVISCGLLEVRFCEISQIFIYMYIYVNMRQDVDMSWISNLEAQQGVHTTDSMHAFSPGHLLFRTHNLLSPKLI